MNYRKKVRLGDVLVKKGIIDENQLQTALSRQREQGKMLGEMVIALGYATQRDINEALCDSLGIDFVDMRETEIRGLLLELKGEFPVLHEVINYDRYRFEILEMDVRRIVKVKVTVGMNTSKEKKD